MLLVAISLVKYKIEYSITYVGEKVVITPLFPKQCRLYRFYFLAPHNFGI